MNRFQDLQIISRIPMYKQVIEHIETSIMNGELKPGDPLPSMKELASTFGVSKETIKKAYVTMVKRGLLVSHQGVGFFIRKKVSDKKVKVLLMVNNLSAYKQLFINAFLETLGKSTEAHILIHNQDVDLLRYYLDQSLGKYDFYIVMPHFSRDENTTQKVIRQLSRIPARQLILADNMIESYHGNFGAVYQDFNEGLTYALTELLDDLRAYPRLDMFTLANCLYGDIAELAVARFCDKNNYHASFHHELSPKYIRKNQVCLFYNHIDQVMLQLNEIAEQKGLMIGKDIKVISYNDTPVCKLLCGGITTISTDFVKMGRLCAEMVRTGELTKIKCEFKVTRRRTF